jgi:hypothetical protein
VKLDAGYAVSYVDEGGSGVFCNDSARTFGAGEGDDGRGRFDWEI